MLPDDNYRAGLGAHFSGLFDESQFCARRQIVKVGTHQAIAMKIDVPAIGRLQSPVVQVWLQD